MQRQFTQQKESQANIVSTVPLVYQLLHNIVTSNKGLHSQLSMPFFDPHITDLHKGEEKDPTEPASPFPEEAKTDQPNSAVRPLCTGPKTFFHFPSAGRGASYIELQRRIWRTKGRGGTSQRAVTPTWPFANGWVSDCLAIFLSLFSPSSIECIRQLVCRQVFMAWVRLDSAVDNAAQSRPPSPSRPSRRILFDATNAQGEGLMLFFRRKAMGRDVLGAKQVMQLFIGIQHGHSAPRPGEATVTLLCEICTQVRIHCRQRHNLLTPFFPGVAACYCEANARVQSVSERFRECATRC